MPCSMTIHWSLFVPGVVLLLYPADLLLSSLVELRSFDCFQNLENSPRYRPWWWVPALWLDPLRGFLGTVLVQRAAVGITNVTWSVTPKPEYALFVAVLAAGVLCQTITRRGDAGVLLAPVGFVAGVVTAMVPLPVALIGIVTAALGLFAFRRFPAFFAFGLVAVGLLGLVLGAGLMRVLPAVGVFALPLIAGVVTGGALELPTRNASGRPQLPPLKT